MTDFVESNLSRLKRWESDIDSMAYLISQAKFDRDKERMNGHLADLRRKCERLEKEIGDFFDASKVEESIKGHSER